MTSEQKLWASIFDRPGSFVKKSFVTSQLAFHSDEDSTAWLKDRQHLFKVQQSHQQVKSNRHA